MTNTNYPRDRLLNMAVFRQPSDKKWWSNRGEECTFTLLGQGDDKVQTVVVSAGIFSFPSVQELRKQVEWELETASTISTTTGTPPPPPTDAGGGGEATRLPPTKGMMMGRRRGQRLINVVGEARSLHRTIPQGSIVQAASQFNLLEFPSPSVIPEDGITGYQYDRTQGPACAMAAAAGTAYRNYLVPVVPRLPAAAPTVPADGAATTKQQQQQQQRGQTQHHQLNGLQDVEDYVSSWHQQANRRRSNTSERPLPAGSYWKVSNGYIESTRSQLEAFNQALATSSTTASTPGPLVDLLLVEDNLISRLRIGVQEDTTVTDDPELHHTVTQTFNSAVSIGYSNISLSLWEPLARLVLKATYEATLLVGVLKTMEYYRRLSLSQSSSPTTTPPPPPILLTKVGGGVFGNRDSWIIEAIERAMDCVAKYGIDLDIRIVHYGRLDRQYRVLERDWTDSK